MNKGRGWWGHHPNQFGDRTLRERLWDVVDGPWVEGVEWDDCWLFTAAWRSKHGYGRIKSGNHQYPVSRGLQAHVIAFELVFGPMQPEDYARHACDVRLCCNPFHIAPGSHADNERDKVDKEFAWACTPLGQPPRSMTDESSDTYTIDDAESAPLDYPGPEHSHKEGLTHDSPSTAN